MSIGKLDQISICNSFIVLVMVGHSKLSFCDTANNLLLIATVIVVSLQALDRRGAGGKVIEYSLATMTLNNGEKNSQTNLMSTVVTPYKGTYEAQGCVVSKTFYPGPPFPSVLLAVQVPLLNRVISDYL